jgi:hypothetical protein
MGFLSVILTWQSSIQELIIKYSKKNCFDKFNVGNCDECLWALKDTLDGVLIGDSFNQTAAFLDVLAKTLIYTYMIQQLEATPYS